MWCKLSLETPKYNFLHFGSFFDKHYHSCKTLTMQSILVFLTDACQLIVADMSDKTVTVYDSRQRPVPDLSRILKFISDYVDEYGKHLWQDDHWNMPHSCYNQPSNPFVELSAITTLDMLSQLNAVTLRSSERPEDLGVFYCVELLSGCVLNY